MEHNPFIVYVTRDRVATDIESLAMQLKTLSTIIKPSNNHISNEEFLAVDGEISDLITNTAMAVNNIVSKIKSMRGV